MEAGVRSIWPQLTAVSGFTLQACGAHAQWEGVGQVRVERMAPHVVAWHEEGHWVSADGQEAAFHNVYRWRLLPEAGHLALAHLRRGAERPVALVHLAQETEGRWASVRPHRCGADRYAARLILERDRLVLRWRITGPKKALRLRTIYHGA